VKKWNEQHRQKRCRSNDQGIESFYREEEEEEKKILNDEKHIENRESERERERNKNYLL
jgi:hypothetical protein